MVKRNTENCVAIKFQQSTLHKAYQSDRYWIAESTLTHYFLVATKIELETAMLLTDLTSIARLKTCVRWLRTLNNSGQKLIVVLIARAIFASNN